MRSYSRQEASTADEAHEALKIGRAAVEAGNLDKGLEVYQSILEIDPDNKIVRERIRKLGARPAIKPPKLSRIRLAPMCKVDELMTAAESGRFLAVLYDLNELIPQYPRDPILYFLKANVLRELGRVKESVVNYEKSIGLNSRYSPAHLNLSCSYKEIGDLTAAKKSLERAIELAEPGMRKHDLVGELFKTSVQGEADSWGDYPAIVPLLPSGEDASAPHLTWNGEALKSGEATFIEQSGCYRRYHAPLCRTIFFGKPPTHFSDASEALTEGLNAGIEVARAGNRACDIARALDAELHKVGIERPNRCGYAVGLSYPPDWGEHTVSLRASDETVLEPGMTFHFMPGLWMDDWGLETTETIVIREDGPAEPLCNIPRQLFIKD